MTTKLRIMAIGAHPDDCELKAGGCAALWAKAGHAVIFVSATNGGAGHHKMAPADLVVRRKAEAAAAAKVIGIESRVLDIPDGALEPTLANRHLFIRMIREFQPDLVLTHRPNDYHPDHRYTSQLVQDSSFLVTVPHVVPETPCLKSMPAIAYFSDHFQKPYPFTPGVAVDIDGVIEQKLSMIHCHVSQFYEWLVWNKPNENEVPKEDAARREWLRHRLKGDENCAKKYRRVLQDFYGLEAGEKIRHAEAFEACEYGAALRWSELFPI